MAAAIATFGYNLGLYRYAAANYCSVMLKLATVQGHIEAGVAANGAHIRLMMQHAAAAGAQMIHFPEAALSGYPDLQVPDWHGVDWGAIERERESIAALAARLSLWVVLGCNHRLPPPHRPHNSLYVISDRGEVAGRYDKRLCSNAEVTWWYTPGTRPLVFDVGGIRFGTALCIEVTFPELFAAYERDGVQCVLLSSYGGDPAHRLLARAHAAANGFWVSHANVVACSARVPSGIIGPDGEMVASCRPGLPGVAFHVLDPTAPAYSGPTMVRSWRARARSGEIYAGLAV